MPNIFGSTDFAGTRLVTCQRGESSGNWAQCGVYVDGRVVNIDEGLLFARAVEFNGLAWIVGAGHDSNKLTVVCEDGRREVYTNAQFVAMNRPCVIEVNNGALEIAYMDTAFSVQRSSLSPTNLTLTPIEILQVSGTSQGILDIANGVVTMTDPVNKPLGPYSVRYPTVRQDVTLAQAADPQLEDGLVAQRNGVIGKVVDGLIMEPHISPDGARWCGWTTSGQTLSGPIPDPLVPIPDIQPLPPPSPWARRFIMAGFFLKRGTEGDPTAPFDMEISANGWGDTNTRDVIAAWVDDAETAKAEGRLVATYVDIPSSGYDRHDVLAKRALGKPIVWNYDYPLSSAPSRPADFTTGDIESIEVYPFVGQSETPAQTIARVEPVVREICNRNRGGTVGIVQCTYTEHWPLKQIRDLQPLTDDLVRRVLGDYPDITLLVMDFAWLRAQYGASASPVLAQHARDRYTAQPNVPCPPLNVIPPPSGVNLPDVEVLNWTMHNLQDGAEFKFYDAANPQFGTIRVWVEHGGIYASVTNEEGKASTEVYRPVDQ